MEQLGIYRRHASDCIATCKTMWVVSEILLNPALALETRFTEPSVVQLCFALPANLASKSNSRVKGRVGKTKGFMMRFSTCI